MAERVLSVGREVELKMESCVEEASELDMVEVEWEETPLEMEDVSSSNTFAGPTGG